ESNLAALAEANRGENQVAASGLGSIASCLGNAGAATGLAAVARAALCLGQQILPGPGAAANRLQMLASRLPSAFVPIGPQYWIRNRPDGPRRAVVNISGLGGIGSSAILEEFEKCSLPAGQGSEPAAVDFETEQPLGPRPLGIFGIEADSESALAERLNELADLAREQPAAHVDDLARQWWRSHPNNPRLRFGVALVADRAAEISNLARELLSRPNGN